MVGFPFLGGFASKLNFALAAMDVGGARTMLVLITLAISTWLNTLYFLRTVITLYRKPVPGAVYSVARGQRGFCFNASLVAFSIVNVALGLFAQTFVSAITAGLATFVGRHDVVVVVALPTPSRSHILAATASFVGF